MNDAINCYHFYLMETVHKYRSQHTTAAYRIHNLPCTDFEGSLESRPIMGVYCGSEQSIEQRFLMILAFGLVSRVTQHCTSSDRLQAALSWWQKHQRIFELHSPHDTMQYMTLNLVLKFKKLNSTINTNTNKLSLNKIKSFT